jgi:hypothetical protein
MQPYLIGDILMDHPEPIAGFATDSAPTPTPVPALDAEIDIELDEEDSL